MALYDKASLVLIPSQYKEGKLYNIKPLKDSFEFERGTAATRVNSDGLIERIEPLTQDIETIVNGSFTGGSTGWVLTTSWSYDVDRVFFDKDYNRIDNLIQVNQPWTIHQGKQYRLSFDIENVDQNDLSYIFIRIVDTAGTGVQDIANSYQYYSNGTHTIIFSPVADSTRIDFYARGNVSGNSGGSFYIDNISIKELQGNIPRIDYSGTEPSLLLEPQRTNEVTYSEIFNSSSTYYFGPLGATIDSTSELAPDGTNTASTMLSSGQGKVQTVYRSLPANTTYTLSVFVKNVDATGYETRILANGGSGGTNITSVSRINEINTTSWTRVIHTFTTHTTAQNYIMYISNNVDSGESVQLWGAQLEQGSYATSYIPTNGATETRLADVCKGGGDASVFNDSEGVFYAEIKKIDPAATNYYLLSINDGTGTSGSFISIGINQTGTLYINCRDGSSNTLIQWNNAPANVGEYYKIAGKYKSGDSAFWVNGQEVRATSSTGNLTNLNRLEFSHPGTNIHDYKGCVRALHYFPEALTDTQLQELTTI